MIYNRRRRKDFANSVGRIRLAARRAGRYDARRMSVKSSKRTKLLRLAKAGKPQRGSSASLLNEVRDLVLSARGQVAQLVNTGLTLLHWQVGNRIRREVLKEKRAEYGEEIVSTLARQLEPEFGRGFSQQNLFRMVELAEAFPDEKIVATLSKELSWAGYSLRNCRRMSP